jgi:hypothetical protein
MRAFVRYLKNTDRSSFYTTEKLSGTREKTPEGFLLLRNVPLARTGELSLRTR